MSGNLSLKMLFGSIILGILYGFIGEFLYLILDGRLPRVVVTAIYFIGLLLFLSLGMTLVNKMIYSVGKNQVNFTKVILAFVVMLIASMLFEFIYDVIQKKDDVVNAESYVFLLDVSGSMDSNDPANLRYEAIDKLLEQKDDSFEYAVYTFSDEIYKVRDMQPVSVPMDFYSLENGGMTAINGVLSTLYNDIEHGNIKINKNTRVILLSDGIASDINFFNKSKFIKLLGNYAGKGITVSTIGLIEADKDLMNMIAEKTGGVYIDVQDATLLESAMVQATSNDNLALRNLLNYREMTDLDILLAILRILFLVGIAMIIAFEKTVICSNFVNTNSVWVGSVIGGVLSGIAIEVGMNTLGILPLFMRVIACIMLAFTILFEDVNMGYSDDAGVRHGGDDIF